MPDIEAFLSEAAQMVETQADELITRSGIRSSRLEEAMRWSFFGGGKRFRPALVLASGRTFGAPDTALLRTAASVELLHTYSLIHDDLPSMDDDDLRRGRLTCHKKFDEATAILAGDAMQALAFRAIADDRALDTGVRVRLLSELGDAAMKMVAGQQMDLDAEGATTLIDDIRLIHRGKTGALIRFSAIAGGIIAGVGASQADALDEFGQNIGLLFQITDDILDVTQTSETLGKTAGKDAASYKATYPGLMGIDAAREHAAEIAEHASGSLSDVISNSGLLSEMCSYVLTRSN
jgi:geranylgeranyl pyrophosphate synthase